MADLRLCKATAALLLLVICCAEPSMAVLFSELRKTLIVTASPKPGEVLYAGEDRITVTWQLNQSEPASTGSTYATIKVSLCYAPVSQKDRGWRKTVDDLKKDKTCQFTIVKQPYSAANSATPGTHDYLIDRDVPTAMYFVRAYALDSSGTQVAYGQTTVTNKTTNLFEVMGISGRTASLEIAAWCFSAFSVAALVFFYVVENKKRK